MARSIIINAKASVLKAAVIEDKSLDNLFIDKNQNPGIVGNIYIGRIDRVLASIQAAFVDIGIGKNGFLQLRDSDFEKKEDRKNKKNFKFSPRPELKEGSLILVQVVKEEIGTKGVRLDTEISLPGRFLVLMPYGKGRIHISRKIIDEEHREFIRQNIIPKLSIPNDMDVIVRTASVGVKIKFIQRDIDNLLSSWKNIQNEIDKKSDTIKCVHEELDLMHKMIRDWLDDRVETIFIDDKTAYDNINQFIRKYFGNPKTTLRLYKGNVELFDKFGITRQIEKLYEKRAWLKCGGYIIIEKTEALVAIDVNTGKNVRNQNNDETILETNLQAAEEIARQLRLRNMGGMVIIDFIDMKNKNHQRDVLRRLQEKLENDKANTKIYPFTQLGLVQMIRQRVEEAWEQHFFIDCTYCGGTGRILSVSVISEHLLSKIRLFLVAN
ncbi:MAG: Rne/Rng family ribonuclease, partial [Syntrophales bacterium LBB04]|nr:Rne/Rng family ribonuclease [Syntrophales bacterium LBB04]